MLSKVNTATLTKIIVISLLMAFAFQVLNKTFFTHTHKTATGMLVVHAHPYNMANEGANSSKHGHNKSDFQFFNFFYSMLSICLAIAAFVFVAKENPYKRAIKVREAYLLLSFVFYSNKAPPILL